MTTEIKPVVVRPNRIARPRTEDMCGLKKYILQISSDDVELGWRPRTRVDCELVERPCCFVGCKWNLYLDVLPTGNVKFNFPDIEPWEMQHSCVLDLVDEFDGMTLDQIAIVMNISRERARQIEEMAMAAIAPRLYALNEEWDGPVHHGRHAWY